MAIDRVGRAGHRPCPKRASVVPVKSPFYPLYIAAHHPCVRKQVVAEQDGLPTLKVGKSWDQHVAIAVDAEHQGRNQLAQYLAQFAQPTAQPQPNIGRNLIIARSGGVKARTRRTDQRDQAAFDRHVYVFELGPGPVNARRQVVPDPVQSAQDQIQVLGRQQPDLGQHPGVRPATFQVLPPHMQIDIERLRKRDHPIRRPAGKTPVPQRH
jgi:hypothetical protein